VIKTAISVYYETNSSEVLIGINSLGMVNFLNLLGGEVEL